MKPSTSSPRFNNYQYFAILNSFILPFLLATIYTFSSPRLHVISSLYSLSRHLYNVDIFLHNYNAILIPNKINNNAKVAYNN